MGRRKRPNDRDREREGGERHKGNRNEVYILHTHTHKHAHGLNHSVCIMQCMCVCVRACVYAFKNAISNDAEWKFNRSVEDEFNKLEICLDFSGIHYHQPDIDVIDDDNNVWSAEVFATKLRALHHTEFMRRWKNRVLTVGQSQNIELSKIHTASVFSPALHYRSINS